MRVELTEAQQRDARLAATAAGIEAKVYSARAAVFDPPDRQRTDTLAYGAEIAASVATGIAWRGYQPMRRRHGGDLVDGTEVRHTERADGGLAIRASDYDERPYVLVTGSDGVTYDVHGWLYAAEAKRPAYYRDDWAYPAWCAPQCDLRPIAELAKGQNNAPFVDATT